MSDEAKLIKALKKEIRDYRKMTKWLLSPQGADDMEDIKTCLDMLHRQRKLPKWAYESADGKEDLSMWCAPGQTVGDMLQMAAERD